MAYLALDQAHAAFAFQPFGYGIGNSLKTCIVVYNAVVGSPAGIYRAVESNHNDPCVCRLFKHFHQSPCVLGVRNDAVHSQLYEILNLRNLVFDTVFCALDRDLIPQLCRSLFGCLFPADIKWVCKINLHNPDFLFFAGSLFFATGLGRSLLGPASLGCFRCCFPLCLACPVAHGTSGQHGRGQYKADCLPGRFLHKITPFLFYFPLTTSFASTLSLPTGSKIAPQ